jgi:hypothetical protein
VTPRCLATSAQLSAQLSSAEHGLVVLGALAPPIRVGFDGEVVGLGGGASQELLLKAA